MLVTDYMQFIVMSAGLIVVTILILMNVGWENMVTTVELQYGAGGFNPFVNPTMGWQYVALQLNAEYCCGLDVANHYRARACGKGHGYRTQGLHANQLLLCVSLSYSGYLGHRRARKHGPAW